MLREVPDAESTLGALAVRDHREQPLRLADQDLRDLRHMLEAVPTALSDELGPRIGRAIAVNVHHWQRGRRIHSTARPAEVLHDSVYRGSQRRMGESRSKDAEHQLARPPVQESPSA